MADLQSAPLNISSLGCHTVITGSTSLTTIQVVGIVFQCSVATCLTIKCGNTTCLSGPMSFLGGGGFLLPIGGNVYYQCDGGTNFVFDLTGLTGQVGGTVYYYQF